jgi:hypothetical protein
MGLRPDPVQSAGRHVMPKPELWFTFYAEPELRFTGVRPVTGRRLAIYMRMCVLGRVGWLRGESRCG